MTVFQEDSEAKLNIQVYSLKEEDAAHKMYNKLMHWTPNSGFFLSSTFLAPVIRALGVLIAQRLTLILELSFGEKNEIYI
jgi:hypothetical protein